MRIKMFVIVLCLCAQSWAQGNNQYISPTKYDYSQVSQQITANCGSKYEQAKAIYRWLCDNISYDTSYSIYTADECWEQRKGVCQAYCELFYRLAEPVGLDVRIITGDAKTMNSGAEGHAWVFAIVEGDNVGVMIDPTWGAGSVNGSVFIRSDNDDSWFHVDPYWMIFTHFPDDSAYQLLPQPISRDQFDALPLIKPMWGEYGFDGKTIYDMCISGDADLPVIYKSGVGKLRIVEMPLQRTLRVGMNYRFAVRKLQQCEVAVLPKQADDGWQLQGSTYYMDYMPVKAGEVVLGIGDGGKSYFNVVEYEVAQPDAKDLARLEKVNPMLMPELTDLPGFNASVLRRYGIDGRKLLAEVRNGSVDKLPKFYSSTGEFSIVEMPFNGVLRKGHSYVFKITPHKGLNWALINEGTWYREWNVDASTGIISMSVTPENTGRLVLAVQLIDGGKYEYCIEYDVR